MVAHTINPSTLEAEADGFLSLRPAWSIERIPRQSWLHIETLSQESKTKKRILNIKMQTSLTVALR